jgi:beta-phosphoglucomutase-like phosphatase (HAD superfamily)
MNKLIRFKAIIFDMDGTLVDNMSFHTETWLLFLKKHDIQAALATMGDMPNIDFILDELGIRPFFCSITGGHEIVRGKPTLRFLN